jgi:hypothetical protein
MRETTSLAPRLNVCHVVAHLQLEQQLGPGDPWRVPSAQSPRPNWSRKQKVGIDSKLVCVSV